MQVIESILADAAQIAVLRRDIHAHPELCFQEKRTSDLIAKQLTEWGIPIHRGMGTTGIVAILKNGSSDRAVGLRADIDALPITEHNQFAHKSTEPGKMHMRAATTAIPRCCSPPPSTWPSSAQLPDRHRLPDLPALSPKRRWRARGQNDQGRDLRQVPDGGGVRRPRLAGHESRPVRTTRPARRSPRATSSGS
jgi:hypothetical protein